MKSADLLLEIGAVDRAAMRLWAMFAQAPDPAAPGARLLAERAAGLQRRVSVLRQEWDRQAELARLAALRDANEAERARRRSLAARARVAA